MLLNNNTNGNYTMRQGSFFTAPIHEIISDGTAKKLAEQYFGEDFASNVSLYK